MSELLQFLMRHGYGVIFVWVLAEQVGLPLPALPVLLVAGALAGAGRLDLGLTILLALLASLAADALWYELGRRRGGKVLGWLCSISLEPDSCVRRSENLFSRYGARSLIVAKFVPGLNTVAPPLAGIIGMGLGRFLLFDAVGALLWAGGFVFLGYLFSGQIEWIADLAVRLGSMLLWLLAAALAAYLVQKYRQRRRFLRQTALARITPEELQQRLEAGEPVAVVDLRHPLDFLAYPRVIDHAIRLAPEELEQRHQEIPRDREVVLYCT